MRYLLTLTVFLLLITHKGVAQDKDMLAQRSYLQAEELYNQQKYSQAIVELKKAQDYLGMTNSKILYLKVKALDGQFKSNSDFYSDLYQNYTRFFKITDINNYPNYKYLEIVQIKEDAEKFKKTDSLSANDLINSNSYNSVSAYVNSNQNSFYISQLQKKLGELQVIENKREDSLQIVKKAEKAEFIRKNNEIEKLSIKNRLAEINTTLLPKARRARVASRLWSGALLAGGMGVFVAGAAAGGEEEGVAQSVTAMLIGIGGGGAALFGGLVFFSKSKVKRLKEEKRLLLRREQEKFTLNFSPSINKVNGAQYVGGVNFRLTF